MYVANTTGGLMLQTMLYLANHTSRLSSNDYKSNELLPKSDMQEAKDIICYDIYGCFPINTPWTTKTRQINVHPQEPSEIQALFRVYTTKNFNRPLEIDLSNPDAVHNANINPNGRIYLIAHGYLETGLVDWMIEMARSLLLNESEEQATVVLIDWGGGSNPPYVQAAANIRLVGAITAHIINMIYEELGMHDLRKMHMIGHSLGSHLAGYTGHYLQKNFGLKLGRITGLDPAAPLFADTDKIVRLDRSDAHFVDVIHTDASLLGGLGMHQRIGHVDFYPNGGTDNPGCDAKLQEYMQNSKNNVVENVQEFLGCNHIRSYQYFIESIQSECPFMGITCESYEKFLEGKCARCFENQNDCIRMGYHSIEDYNNLMKTDQGRKHRPLIMYLMTDEQPPFCRYHYKITIRVADHDESTIHGGEIGTVSLRLHSRNSKHASEQMKFSTNPMYFEPGFEYSSLVSGSYVENPQYATVLWEYETSIFNPLTWRILTSPRIYLSYITIESIESPQMYLKLCPLQEQLAVTTGDENIMQSKYCQPNQLP